MTKMSWLHAQKQKEKNMKEYHVWVYIEEIDESQVPVEARDFHHHLVETFQTEEEAMSCADSLY